MTSIELPTTDGPCRLQLFTPAKGVGPWPVLLFFFDGGGQRGSQSDMAQRFADEGYLVAMPDLFHRAGSVFDTLPAGMPREASSVFTMLRDPEFRAMWGQKFFAPATDEKNLLVDVGATLEYLKGQANVRPGPVATTGYCMGGNVSFRVATLFPERVALAASFHGGGLASPQPNSPHLKAARIKARVYIAGAIEDSSFSEEAKALLASSLTAAGVRHEIETYPAKHGFAVSDSPMFDRSASERHHATLTRLLKATFA